MHEIHLDIKGERYKFSFGLQFIGMLLDELDCEIGEIGVKLKRNPYKTLPTMMHTSYVVGLREQGILKHMTITEFYALIMDEKGIKSEAPSLFLQAFTDSMKVYNKNTGADESQEPKKKSTLSEM
jgi:hypothetical protein